MTLLPDGVLASESRHFNLSSVSLESELTCSLPPCHFPLCYQEWLAGSSSPGWCNESHCGTLEEAHFLLARGQQVRLTRLERHPPLA